MDVTHGSLGMRCFDSASLRLCSGQAHTDLTVVYVEKSSHCLGGIQFLVEEHGNAKSVLIDLEKWGELWEDIYDGMIIESRRGEPTIPWEVLKTEMEAEIERQRSTDG